MFRRSFSLKSKFGSLNEVKSLWRSVDAVCFDVDSTVINCEGIDVLADFCGHGKEVAEFTRKAMSGTMPFEVALEERLKIIKPSLNQVNECLNSNQITLTPGIKDLVFGLQSRNKKVFLISGGFRQMIFPHALELNVDVANIFANSLTFEKDGSFKDFDRNELTSKSGGKAKVIQKLKQNGKIRKIAMIGDGFTDLEARPPADVFIGFGGIVERQSVKQNADWFVNDFATLLEELNPVEN